MNQCMQESNLSHFDLHMFDATSASLASATTSTRKNGLIKHAKNFYKDRQIKTNLKIEGINTPELKPNEKFSRSLKTQQ